MSSRRLVLMFMLLGLAGHAIPSAAAKDGDGGGDNNGGDSDGGGDGDNSGSGGGGGDDGGSDDSDGGDDDGDSSGDSGSDSRKSDDNRIRNAVRKGDAQPLRSILSRVRQRYEGNVVRIRLTGTGSRMAYRIRVIDRDNKLIEIRVNAKTGRIVRATGVK